MILRRNNRHSTWRPKNTGSNPARYAAFIFLLAHSLLAAARTYVSLFSSWPTFPVLSMAFFRTKFFLVCAAIYGAVPFEWFFAVLTSQFDCTKNRLTLSTAKDVLRIPLSASVDLLSAVVAIFELTGAPCGARTFSGAIFYAFGRWVPSEFFSAQCAREQAMRSSIWNDINKNVCTRLSAISKYGRMQFCNLRVIAPDKFVTSVKNQLAHIVEVAALEVLAIESQSYPEQGISVFNDLAMCNFNRPCNGLFGLFGVLRCVNFSRFMNAKFWTLLRNRIAWHKGCYAYA